MYIYIYTYINYLSIIQFFTTKTEGLQSKSIPKHPTEMPYTFL